MSTPAAPRTDVSSQINMHPYMRTRHPEVLRAWGTAQDQRRTLIEASSQWAEQVSGQSAVMISGNMLAGMKVTGLPAGRVDPEALPGRWKKPHKGVITPYANSPIHDQMQELKTEPVTLPGRPTYVWSMPYMGSGRLFEWDGHLYSAMELRDEAADSRWDQDQQIMREYGWEQIRGSEFLSAHEQMQEQAKG